MYFSSEQVSISFKRLSSRKSGGKTHMERTSALMYFLAFDVVCKSKGGGPVDFDPEKIEGKNNRKSIELEFTKLVLLNKEHNKIAQVSELGKIDYMGKDPEKRISSNFLTVPLKKASEHSTPYSYPKRPATPLMRLGQAATGQKWGINYCDDWRKNLPVLLSDIKQSSPFTDLAVFILRDTLFDRGATECITTLSTGLSCRFSKELAEFWIERIEKEKLFAKHIQLPLSENHDSFGKKNTINDLQFGSQISLEQLSYHIKYLEDLLSAHNINYRPL
ncbi:MAG: hypothetical protein EOO20_07760 [Chryseobacterium sp.]|nr:MAG: hypothetical protein EOO20_07760 [Chryseobacterium sp.]